MSDEEFEIAFTPDNGTAEFNDRVSHTESDEAIDEQFRKFIQSNDPSADGSVLVAFVVVCEWVNPDGENWMSRIYSGGLSPRWRDGMLDEAKGDWFEPEDEDDE